MELFDMIGVDAGYVLIGALAVILILLILIIVLFVKHSRLVKKYKAFMTGADAASLESVVTKRFSEVDTLKGNITEINRRLEVIDNTLLHTYQKMALVKYDAFQKMGGNLSFVLALLTADNNGWIINAMHSSKEGCYVYSKEVIKGECAVILSEEEKQALEEAKSKHI